MKRPWSGVTCGNSLIKSSVRIAPSSVTSSRLMIITGLTAVRLRRGMRDPVMTMGGAGWAGASATGAAESGGGASEAACTDEADHSSANPARRCNAAMGGPPPHNLAQLEQ